MDINCDHEGRVEVDKNGIYDPIKGFFICGKCGKYFEYEETENDRDSQREAVE